MRRIKNETGIPDEVIDSLARALLPAIQKYFETEEGQKEFAEWQKEQELKNVKTITKNNTYINANYQQWLIKRDRLKI